MPERNVALNSQQERGSYCPLCNVPKAERHTRGPLTTQLNPPAAWWRGKPLPVTGYPLKLLDLLCHLGKASLFAVQVAGSGEDANPETIRTVISQLRRNLPNGARITSIHGWGYELILAIDGEEP